MSVTTLETRRGRFALMLVALALAAGIRWLFNPFPDVAPPFYTFYFATLASAWYGGWMPGLVSTALGAIISTFFFGEPAGRIFPADTASQLGVLRFVTVGAMVSIACESLHRSRRTVVQDREAARRLAAIVESSDDAIVAKSLDGIIQSWNAGAERLFGYSAFEAVGRSITMLLPADRIAEEEHILTNVRAGRRVEHMDTVRRRKDGELIPVSLTVSPVKDEAGHIVGASKIARDITERTQTAQELRESHERFRDIFDRSPVALWEGDGSAVLRYLRELRSRGVDDLERHFADHPEDVRIVVSLFRVLAVNRESLRVFGADSEAELLGTIPEVFTDDAFAVFEELFVAFGAGARSHTAPAQLRTIRGQQLETVLTVARPASDAPNSSRWLVSVVDVSELHRQSRRAALLVDVVRTILEATAADGALSMRVFEMIRESLDADILFNYRVDHGALELVAGAGIPETVQGSVRRLAVVEMTRGPAAARRALVTADAARIQSDLRVIVGRLGARAYAWYPLLGRNGDILGTFAVASTTRAVFDEADERFLLAISHFLALAWDRQFAEDRLADQDRRKDDFLATLAHELRNPLAPIRHGLDILDREDVPEETAAEARAMMGRQLGQLVRLVDDLLDLSRVRQGKISLHREHVTVRDMIEAGIETCRPSLDLKGQVVTVCIADEPLAVDGDATRLNQIVANFVSNASKYSDAGNHIRIDARREGREFVCSVTDTGVGLTPEARATVWTLFSQVRDTMDKAQGGLGIGLALVKQLVEMHGGTVAVESEGVGRGSTFTFRLPLSAHDAPRTLAPRTGALAEPAAGQRVLVVDDNVDAAASLSMLLQALGHNVSVAHDASEALAMAHDVHPTVAFVDIGLPDVDGYTLAQQLRSTPKTAGIALVALTGWGTSADRQRSREAGFALHLTKPVRMTAIEDAIGLFAVRQTDAS